MADITKRTAVYSGKGTLTKGPLVPHRAEEAGVTTVGQGIDCRETCMGQCSGMTPDGLSVSTA